MQIPFKSNGLEQETAKTAKTATDASRSKERGSKLHTYIVIREALRDGLPCLRFLRFLRFSFIHGGLID